MIWESRGSVCKDSSDFNRSLVKINEETQKAINAQTTQVKEMSEKVDAKTKKLLKKNN